MFKETLDYISCEAFSLLVIHPNFQCVSFFYRFPPKAIFGKIQMLRYILEIWDKDNREMGGPGYKLPMIIPVIIAHAREGWEQRTVADYVDYPSEDFRAYIPDFSFVLYDSVTENPDDYEFIETLKALLLIWRHYYSPDFMEHLVRVFRLFNRIFPDAKFKDFVISIMEYLSAVRSEEEFIDIQEAARKEFQGGEEFMGTIAEMFIRKGEERGLILGRQEGMKEGELKSAQEMLIRSLRLRFEIVSPPVKDRVRSIQSLDTVNDLFELSFKCSTIEDFNEYLTKIMDN